MHNRPSLTISAKLAPVLLLPATGGRGRQYPANSPLDRITLPRRLLPTLITQATRTRRLSRTRPTHLSARPSPGTTAPHTLPEAGVALIRLGRVHAAMQLGGRKQRHNQGDGRGGEHSAAYVAERSCTCLVRPPVLGPALTLQAWAGISASAMPGHRYARSRSPCRRSAYFRPQSAAYEVRAAATPWISRPTG